MDDLSQQNPVQNPPMTEPVTPVQTPPVKQPPPPPPPSRSFISKPLIILLIAAILFAIFYAGTYFKLNQTLTNIISPPKPTPSPTASIPSPTPNPTTANWKTYANEKYSFEIKYHPESNPNEFIGNNEVGQFNYLLLIRFGTNPIKSPYGYELKVNNQKSLDDYRTELVGHITDRIDSEEETVINNNTWKKINYKIFVTTDYVPITMAIINHAGYSFAISSSAFDINQILSTFKFLDQNQKDAEGKSCGGIMGEKGPMACPSGYYCRYTDSHPDASGKCVKE